MLEEGLMISGVIKVEVSVLRQDWQAHPNN